MPTEFQKQTPKAKRRATGACWLILLRLALLCAVYLAAPALSAVDFPLRWRWSNPAPHGNNIIGMAYSASLSLGVQVAERGQIYTSDDLILWLPRDSGATNALRAVTFWGNLIVVTGEGGKVLYADSVDDFQPGTLNVSTTNWLEGVTASSNLLVAVGDHGFVYTSSNGINWFKQPTVSGSPLMRGVAWGNGNFVAVGLTNKVYTSANGTNWTTRSSGTSQNLNRIWFANGRFTAVGVAGAVVTSVNGGTNWSSETAAVGAENELFTASNANGARLVAGDNEVRLNEGLGWTNELAKSNGPPAWTYLSAMGRPDFFLLGGRTGVLAEGYKTNSNPYFWLPSTDSLRPLLFDVNYTTNLYVTVGDHATVMTSGDGVNWTLELVPDSVTNALFFGVGGDTNLLIAAGSQGSLIISPSIVTNIASTNESGMVTNVSGSALGVIWYAVDSTVTNDLQGVGVLGNLYVITGDQGRILTSPDGTNWTAQTSPTNKMFSSVASFPGGLVATGDDGAIATSPDGAHWTLRSSGTTNWLYRVRFLGGLLLAVGQNGTILTSTDGATWAPQSSGTTQWLHDVTRIEDTWFVVGKQGTVLSSTNATEWTDRGTITLKSLYGAATDSRQLITVGLEGIILRSSVVPDLTPMEMLSYARFTSTNLPFVQNLFLFGGQPDQQFTLDRRRDFETNRWVPGAQLEIFDGSGTLFYLETILATNAPSREFYETTLRP